MIKKTIETVISKDVSTLCTVITAIMFFIRFQIFLRKEPTITNYRNGFSQKAYPTTHRECDESEGSAWEYFRISNDFI